MFGFVSSLLWSTSLNRFLTALFDTLVSYMLDTLDLLVSYMEGDFPDGVAGRDLPSVRHFRGEGRGSGCLYLTCKVRK